MPADGDPQHLLEMKGAATIKNFPDLSPGKCSHETPVGLNEVREHFRVRVKILGESLVLRCQHHDVAGAHPRLDRVEEEVQAETRVQSGVDRVHAQTRADQTGINTKRHR